MPKENSPIINVEAFELDSRSIDTISDKCKHFQLLLHLVINA